MQNPQHWPSKGSLQFRSCPKMPCPSSRKQPTTALPNSPGCCSGMLAIFLFCFVLNSLILRSPAWPRTRAGTIVVHKHSPTAFFLKMQPQKNLSVSVRKDSEILRAPVTGARRFRRRLGYRMGQPRAGGASSTPNARRPKTWPHVRTPRLPQSPPTSAHLSLASRPRPSASAMRAPRSPKAPTLSPAPASSLPA